MKILITGVNGLVGKAIAKALLENNEVIGISKSLENKSNLNIQYTSVDISKTASFEVMQNYNVDAIIHCAASLIQNNMSDDLIDTNCIGIKNIANFAVKNNCKTFIYISSIPIIGKPINIPIDENHFVNPKSIYHLTKYFGEVYLKTVFNNINLSILRIPSPLGFDLNENKIVPLIIKKCLKNDDIVLLGNGARIQNYIDIEDIASAVDLIIQKNISGTFNIASKKSYSNKQLAELCIALLNSESKITYTGIDPEENDQWIVSIKKAKDTFNFEPRISIEESIRSIAQRYLK